VGNPTKSEEQANGARQGSEFFRGSVNRITYRNRESGFGVIRALDEEGSRTQVTLVGVFAETVGSGTHLIARGIWTDHPKFGRQFKAYSITETEPTSADAIERYLASGPVKGFGPVLAKRIVDTFGDQALRVLDDEPDRLLEVPGIGAKRIAEIKEQWDEKKGLRDVLLFFHNFGIPAGTAQRIHRAYGMKSVELVSANPYILSRDVWGMGFHSADKIAQALGIERTSRARIVAGLLHTLKKSAEEGHCFLPVEVLLTKSSKLLEIDDEALLSQALAEAVHTDELVQQGSRLYLHALAEAESTLAELVSERLLESSQLLKKIPTEILDEYSHVTVANRNPTLGGAPTTRVELSTEQRQAVRYAATRPIVAISGGPGCGKTTVLSAIASMFRKAGLTLKLAAPTGRAAQRLAEVCGMEASTIHRLLKFDPASRGFLHDENDPLAIDVIIVDECSMIDIPLAASLFKALPATTRIVLVGDADQLPSVGPGLFLGDMLSIQSLPRVILTQLFRRDSQSSITQIAHQINSGIVPSIPTPDGRIRSDAYFLEIEELSAGPTLVERLVTEQIPKKFGFVAHDITVLTPMNQGELGVLNLNRVLQAAIVPERAGFPKVTVGDLEFRLGDRVCQRVNNYNIIAGGIFNGDQGEVLGIDAESQSVTVRMWDGREVTYKRDDLYQLDLAYALTIHRSQGSEVPVVVLALHDSHAILLERQLVYTAITRAKRLLIVVGTRKALATAVKRIRSKRRYTALIERVSELTEQPSVELLEDDL